MRRVLGYQSTDGTIFGDKALCKAHQTNLNILFASRSLVESKFDDALPTSEAVRDAVTDFLIENSGDLLNVLAGKIQAPEEKIETQQIAPAPAVSENVEPDQPVTGAPIDDELDELLVDFA